MIFQDADTEKCGRLLSSLYHVDFDMLRCVVAAVCTNCLKILNLQYVGFLPSVYRGPTHQITATSHSEGYVIAIGFIHKEKEHHFRSNFWACVLAMCTIHCISLWSRCTYVYTCISPQCIYRVTLQGKNVDWYTILLSSLSHIEFHTIRYICMDMYTS